MTELHTGRLTTDAIILVLQTDGGLAVGDGEKPDGAGWQGTPGQSVFEPYVVVYPIAGGQADGTVSSPDADADSIYQFSCVGATRAQAELVADATRGLVLGGLLTIAGRQVMQVRIDTLGGAVREDAGQPPLWQTADRYRVWTTPT